MAIIHHPDRPILEKIGAAALLAEGVPPHCVKAWKYRGVPWDKRAKVARIARQRRIRVPADFSEVRPPDPKKRARQAA